MNKVIVILDNGEGCCDHSVYYIEVRAAFLKDFEKLVAFDDTSRWFIVGVAEKVKWHNDNKPTPEYRYFNFSRFASLSNDQWKTLTPRYRRWLFQKWGQTGGMQSPYYKNDWDRLKGVK